MSSLSILAVLLIAGVVAYFVGRIRSVKVCKGEQRTLHSRPSYHGFYLAVWTVLPAVFVLTLWAAAERPVQNYLAMKEMPASVLETSDAQKSLTMSIVDSIATGLPKLSNEEREIVRKARYGFVTSADARDVLAHHGVILGSPPERYILAAADELAISRAWSLSLIHI